MHGEADPPMHISRIQVDQGFLSGLDLEFGEGLNAVIGPRGSGKTSLVELLRFALGSEPITERARGSLRETISAVLQGGEVTVTLVNDADEGVIVARRADEAVPRSSGRYRTPIVFSQNEIEAVALQASGRAALLDRFRAGTSSEARELESARGTVAGLTAQIVAISRELRGLLEGATEIPTLRKALAEATREEARILRLAEATDQERAAYHALQERLSAVAVDQAVLERTSASLESWTTRLDEVARSAPRAEEARSPGVAGQLASVDRDVKMVRDSVLMGASSLAEHAAMLDELASSLGAAKSTLEAQARDLQVRLETVELGASAIASRVLALREQLARAESILGLAETRRVEMQDLMAKRRAAYQQLEAARRARFEARKALGEEISRELAPAIRVTVESASNVSGYSAAIDAGIRGSGLHARNLVPVLTENMSPLQLAEAIESEDAATISRRSNISLERALRVVETLSGNGTEGLVTAELEDAVTFSLLDGRDFKTTETLSTGQRCTVVLAIVLTAPDAIVVLDQPEDHLDNAFVVATLVKSISRRSTRAQTITTTHNPNIPVLGDATQVTVLGSDGRRGYVVQSRPLLDQSTIGSITSLMEGGREAFLRRAAVYGIP